MRIGGYLWVEMNKARIWDVTQSKEISKPICRPIYHQ